MEPKASWNRLRRIFGVEREVELCAGDKTPRVGDADRPSLTAKSASASARATRASVSMCVRKNNRFWSRARETRKVRRGKI